MYHINSECIYSISSNIISVHTRDKDLSLVIVHKQATNHIDA
jgi:hypothetical protein